MVGRFGPLLPNTTDWFDLWHAHVDWDGEGNQGPASRQQFLRSLFEAWLEVECFARRLERPCQVWVVIDVEDSGQDAVYLHTPNPNQDNFPYQFEGVVWGAVPPEWLAEFLVGSDSELGRSDYNGVVLYWVRRPEGSA